MTQYSVVLSFKKHKDIQFRIYKSNMDDARKLADEICEGADECLNPSYSVAIESEDDGDVLDE